MLWSIVYARVQSLNLPANLCISPCSSNGDTSSAKELMSELVHLYDVVVEDSDSDVDSKSDSTATNGQSSDVVKEKKGSTDGSREGMELAVSSAAKPREGAITCNSTEMIREKQHCISGRLISKCY